MKNILGLSFAVAVLLADSANAHKLSQRHRLQNRAFERSHQREQGIFDKMVELATAEDKVESEKHEATMRKKRQLEDAEKEHDKAVQEEEEEEEKHQQDLEEQR